MGPLTYHRKSSRRLGPDPQSFMLVHLNCNSVLARLSELRQYLSLRTPHVLCLCETRLPPHVPEPRFVGYQSAWLHRQARLGGGLCILVRDDVSYTVNTFLPYENSTIEVLSVKIATRVGSLDIVNIYNPCTNVSVSEFFHLRDQLGDVNIFIGDFNAHSPLWDERGPCKFYWQEHRTVS